MLTCDRCGLDITRLIALGLDEIYARALKWYRITGIILIRHFTLDGKYKNASIEYILNSPCPKRADRSDIALFATEILTGLLEWSYWVPSYDAYNHCYAFAIGRKLASSNNNFWDVLFKEAKKSKLRSKYSIAQYQKIQPSTKLKFDIPLWWFPSITAVAKEYAIIHSLSCPYCFKGSLEAVKQEALTSIRGNVLSVKGGSAPISGDLITCKCSSCGSDIHIIFHFRTPLECENVLNDILLVIVHLMQLFASVSQGYEKFSNQISLILSEVKSHDRKLFNDLLIELANYITYLYSGFTAIIPRRNSEKLKNVYFSWFELLTKSLKSILQEDEWSIILNNIRDTNLINQLDSL